MKKAIVLILSIILVACGESAEELAVTYIAQTEAAKPTIAPATNTPLPTNTPTAVPTNTPQPPTVTPVPVNPLADYGCVRWSTIDRDDLGEYLCVYGTVIDVSDSDKFSTKNFYIVFKGTIDLAETSFRFASFDFFYNGIEKGMCVIAEGEIRSYGENAFLFLNPATDGTLSIWADKSDCSY